MLSLEFQNLQFLHLLHYLNLHPPLQVIFHIYAVMHQAGNNPEPVVFL